MKNIQSFAASAMISATASAIAAVQKDGWALCSLPPNLKTPEVCKAALQRHPYVINAVPRELLTPDFLVELLKMNIALVKGIPAKQFGQVGADELHEFLDENWAMIVKHLGESRSAELANAILSSQKKATREVP